MRVTEDTSNWLSVKYNVSKCIKPDQATWQAGQLAYYENSWKQITSDPGIIQMIMCVNIEFTSRRSQATSPCENTFSKAASEAVRR